MWPTLAVVTSLVGLAALMWALGLRRRLGAHEERLRAFLRDLPLGVMVYGRKAEILECNSAAVDLLGMTKAQLVGKTCFDADWNVVHEDGSIFPAQSHPVAQALATGREVRNVLMGVQRPAAWDRVWLLADAEPEAGPDGKVERVVCTLLDITARKRLEEQIQEQTFRDPLTGCFNRRFIAEFEKLSDAQRGDWGCIVVDVDGLKEYNETHGHQAGDEVLLRMSRFLTLQVRAGEAVVRLGGDEFLVLLVGVNEAGIERVVNRIRAEAVQQAPLSFSMGWAIRGTGEPLEKTIDRAAAGLTAVSVARRPAPRRRGPSS